MKLILGYSSRQKLNIYYTSKANEEFSVWGKIMAEIWELNMDFKTMVNKLTPFVKAYRPTWGDGELLWKKGNILVHNTPYWSGEQKNQMIDGYPYVAEKRDIEAFDWILVKDEN